MDLILSVEEARRSRRMSQTRVAGELAVTQGHYSKVAARQVPLSDKLARRMESWLEMGDGVPVAEGASRRIHELAASIHRECMELMHLVGMAGEAEDARSLDR